MGLNIKFYDDKQKEGEIVSVGYLPVDTKARKDSKRLASSGAVATVEEKVSDASEALQQQIDDIAEKAGSGYIPKGEASVATLNGLSGQENGELYTMTDAGTLTDGSLAVVAGDTVAWDATNEVWYKAMDYAPRQYGTNEVHNLPTTITAFRTGDYIAVDGTNTAKMSKDSLLALTAQNARIGMATEARVDELFENVNIKRKAYTTNQHLDSDGVIVSGTSWGYNIYEVSAGRYILRLCAHASVQLSKAAFYLASPELGSDGDVVAEAVWNGISNEYQDYVVDIASDGYIAIDVYGTSRLVNLKCDKNVPKTDRIDAEVDALKDSYDESYNDTAIEESDGTRTIFTFKNPGFTPPAVRVRVNGKLCFEGRDYEINPKNFWVRFNLPPAANSVITISYISKWLSWETKNYALDDCYTDVNGVLQGDASETLTAQFDEYGIDTYQWIATANVGGEDVCALYSKNFDGYDPETEVDSGKSRNQIVFKNLACNEIHSSVDFMLPSDPMSLMTSDNREITWFTIQEWWMPYKNATKREAGSPCSRITLGLKKAANDSTLYFKVKLEEIFYKPLSGYTEFRTNTDMSYNVVECPLDKWVTLEAYTKIGGDSSGVFVLDAIIDGVRHNVVEYYGITTAKTAIYTDTYLWKDGDEWKTAVCDNLESSEYLVINNSTALVKMYTGLQDNDSWNLPQLFVDAGKVMTIYFKNLKYSQLTAK